MRVVASGSSLSLLSLCVLGLAGCAEDNEAAIKAQASRVHEKIPGARAAQAETQEEFYKIAPGALEGAGSLAGPRPDQGNGYPGQKKKR